MEYYKDTCNEHGFHSHNDQPATISADGIKYWHKDGRRHRDGDQPAVITSDGTKVWYKDGYPHRIGNPAVIRENGLNEYWVRGRHIIKDIPKTEAEWIMLVLKCS